MHRLRDAGICCGGRARSANHAGGDRLLDLGPRRRTRREIVAFARAAFARIRARSRAVSVGAKIVAARAGAAEDSDNEPPRGMVPAQRAVG